MSSSITKLLLIEDDIEDVDLICEYLESAQQFPVTLENVDTLEAGLERISQGGIDLILTDLSLPDEQGLQTFRTLHNSFPQIPTIILSGLDNEEIAVAAMQEGAQDYLVKGHFKSHLLTRAIRYALQRQQIFLELDQRVEQRTAELQKAVKELQAKDAQLQEALTAERKLSELKSRIISTISHEYRTPLTVINSAAELLQVYRHKLDEEKQSKYFRRIQKAVQNLTALVNDVLFINQAEFEKLKFNPQALDLITFTREIVEEMQPNSNNSAHIEFVCQGNCEDFYADTKLLGQLITNLLSNAIKYSPDGGLVTLQLTGETNEVIFRVTDKGIGIPDEDKVNLFSSFHRASNVGTTQGTGLGLSIAKKCVELHEGEIVVESEVGVGTTFIVSLPKRGKVCSMGISKKRLFPQLVC